MLRNPLGINRKRPWTDRYYKRSEGPLPEILRLQFNDKLGMEVLPPGSTWADAGTLSLTGAGRCDGIFMLSTVGGAVNLMPTNQAYSFVQPFHCKPPLFSERQRS
jgi:hypothetical protein